MTLAQRQPKDAPTAASGPSYALRAGAAPPLVASPPSHRAAAGSNAPAAPGRDVWISLAHLASVLGGPASGRSHLDSGGPASGRSHLSPRSLQRWAESLRASGQSCKRSGEWFVHEGARLDGLTVAAHCAQSGWTGSGGPGSGGPGSARSHSILSLPPGHEQWTERDRQRFLDTRTLIRAWRAFCCNTTLPIAAATRAFAATQSPAPNPHALTWSQWAAPRRLRLAHATLYHYEARLTRDGNIDRRGRAVAGEEFVPETGELVPTGKRRAAIDPPAWDMFLSIVLSQNRPPAADAYRLVRAVAQREGWHWPSFSTVRARYDREITQPVEILACEGARKYTAAALPKIEQRIDDVPAGSWWIGDERTLDVLVREPTSGKRGFRTFRPKLTAWLDRRSRMFVGWVLGSLANSDTILSAFKRGAQRYGLPTDVTIDNGRDYRAVGGPRSRKWDELDTARVGDAFAQAGVDAHAATPFWPWAKMIESHFRTVKDRLDRYIIAFRGGCPAEKPADAAAIAEDPSQMLTLPELSDVVTEFFAAHHAEPQSGDGMFGLTPNLVMERYAGPRRECSPDVLALLCSRLVGPVTVGRDGVLWRGVRYGRFDVVVHQMQGRSVMLRIDPDDAARVTICDAQGAPLHVAECVELDGASQEDVRLAATQRAKMRRADQRALSGRRFLQQRTPQQIMQMRREAAEAAEAEQRAKLPPPAAAPPATIVRPDLHAAAEKVRAAQQRRALRKTGTSGSTGVGSTAFQAVPDDPIDCTQDIFGPPAPPPPEFSILDVSFDDPAPDSADSGSAGSGSVGFQPADPPDYPADWLIDEEPRDAG